MVFLVVGHHVGHLHAARPAPAGPEVYQHIAATAAPLAELARLARCVGHLYVGDHGARLALGYADLHVGERRLGVVE